MNVSVSLNTFSQKIQVGYKIFIQYLPQFMASVAFMLVSLALAYLFQFLTKKIILKFDTLFFRATGSTGKTQASLQKTYAFIVSKIVFWIFLIFAFDVCAKVFSWKYLIDIMGTVIAFLPKILTGILILLGGFLFGGFVKTIITQTLIGEVKANQRYPMASIAQVIVTLLITIIAIEQLGVNLSILSSTFIVTIAALLAGVLLAFSLGSRSLTANVIGAQYAKKHFPIGRTIKIANIEGEIIDITQSLLVLENEEGTHIIPGKKFQEEVSFIPNKLDGAKRQ